MTNFRFSPGPHAAQATGWLRGTPAKVFFVIILALLPLAVAAIISNWQSIRSGELQQAELTTAAARQSANQLASDINAIRTAQTLTATVLATEQDPGNVCERMQQLFASMAGKNGVNAAIFDRNGAIICKTKNGAAIPDEIGSRYFGSADLSLAPDLDGLLIRAVSRNGRLTAVALYRREALGQLVSGNVAHSDQSIAIEQRDQKLLLGGNLSHEQNHGAPGTLARVPVGDSEVSIVIEVDATGEGAKTLSLLMPLLLWLAAGFLGWLVVRWTLIEPLIALRDTVADYSPGSIIHPPPMPKMASGEIVELGRAFHEMSEDVAEHEEEMREALERQTQLTREVHHRVKNNLQIISSLISLHWRAAPDQQTGNAYLSIQRRVDALAVVQRNHYAELDEGRGVRASAMMNEIATGLKTSAQIQSNINLEIALRCDDVYLHQDVAAPIAFMTAELADLVIALETGGRLNISLIRLDDDPGRVRFTVESPAFRRASSSDESKVALYERILLGLSRQLRTPLDHDIEKGKYCVVVPVTG
ncbi:MAG: histidine kinase dimerization/phosphoacceptor domain -containing protein [Sphingobium sp.]